MASDPLVDVAWELYDLAPASFTAERNARAKAAKSDDPALATRITALKRASAAAWIVGQLVRHRAARLGEVLELGAELRDAQQDLDAATLTQLTRDRRALTAALAREGAALAEARGVNAPSSVLDEVSQTLQAAMADANAAAAVTSGRLIRGLEVVGFDPVDLDGAVAGPAPDGSSAREPQVDELAARRARRNAERAVRAAEKDLERAEREQETVHRQVADLEHQRDDARSRLDELRRQTAEAEHTINAAEDKLRGLAARVEEADDTSSAARAALDEARAALED
ncbi:transposase [Microbacterium stercoris]|uniref:Transposase n=1 Tax=Microbacterium stercoris TaxID=2820289 RepID=A0A939TR44_9MICO|nr:transposase [Microbacterium stercoris]MBO3664125.1 transposase [Microbacterium stercoris]